MVSKCLMNGVACVGFGIFQKLKWKEYYVYNINTVNSPERGIEQFLFGVK